MKWKSKLAIATALAVACSVLFSVRREYYRHKEPPPGWTIVENGNGKYAACNGFTVIDRDYRAITYGMSYQRAINRAWDQYEYEKAYEERKKSWKPVGH